METTTKTPAKTNLGRKLAEYQNKLKLGESKEFIEQCKSSDAKLFGFKTLEEYQAELDKLEANKVKAGKREIDTQFQQDFCVKSDNLWKAIQNTESEPEQYKQNVTTALTELVTFADSYKSTVGIGESSKRSDFRRMLIASVGGGRIQNYFGGWGDGSRELRHQYGNGRLSADANSNLSGDAITDSIRKVIKLSSPYNNGQNVPQGKSSGYELKAPEPQPDTTATATDKTTTKKQGDKKRNHHKKH